MNMTFYDVKRREKVETAVVEKQEYQSKGQTRYAVKGKTDDGRNLTLFVSKSVYDSITK